MVTSSFLPGRGGIESYLSELCARVSPRLAVLAPGTRDGKALPRDLGYPTTGYDGSLLMPSPHVVRAIEEAARAHGTRRILFGTPWPLALLGPSLAKRGFSYGVIVHGAETIVPSNVPVLKQKLSRSVGEAKVVFPVSDFTRGKLEQLLRSAGRSPPPMHLLRARVDVGRFRPSVRSSEARRRLGLAPEERVVACLGRLVRRKGVHRLIEAYPDLAARVPNVSVLVAGAGPEERRLRRLARATRARVRFLGRVSEENAPSVLGVAEVFAFPVVERWAGMEAEGLGVVLVEAAACGVPCVTGRSGGTAEAVIDGTTGFVVNARRRAELVHAISSLLEDRELARRMGAAGRRHVERSFSGELPTPLLDWLGS
jgi:phosphatidyl-myo-inositol dimannoside synthase